MIGAEFGMDSRTIGKKIKIAGLLPGDDGKYSSKDLVKIIMGDHEREKLLKTTAERKLLDLELGEQEERLCETDLVRQFCEAIASSWRQIIRGFSIPDTDKDQMLQQLREHDIDAILDKLIKGSGKGGT